MLNGADTLALPDNVPPPVFCTVKLRSAVAFTETQPKSWLAGVTEIAGVPLYALPETARIAPAPPVKLTFWL
jgi:hypothetical protein